MGGSGETFLTLCSLHRDYFKRCATTGSSTNTFSREINGVKEHLLAPITDYNIIYAVLSGDRNLRLAFDTFI